MHILWQDLAFGPPSFSVLLDNIVHSPVEQENLHKSAKSSFPFQPPNRYKQPVMKSCASFEFSCYCLKSSY